MATIKIPCIKVRQWVDEWDKVKFNEDLKARPREDFFIFSIDARLLSRLSTVDTRETTSRNHGGVDLGTQRLLENGRAEKIGDYIEYGYPSSDLPKKQRDEDKYQTLRNPGWLPTSIVINIKDGAAGVTLDESGNPMLIIDEDNIDSANLPLEIIDGQHRLAAFKIDSVPNMELPVVAFHNLSKSWQAYLFWTINIRPKKINSSLAFDLYPLLRNMDWLDESEDLNTFRRTREQEIVETMFLNAESPWKGKINMLGVSGFQFPTQAGWIRALDKSYLSSRNGVFAEWEKDHEMLQWNRETQKLFMIYLWKKFHDSISDTGNIDHWWNESETPFYSKKSLIPTEQGIVAFLSVTNSILKLNSSISFGNLYLDDGELNSLEGGNVATFWDGTEGGALIKLICEGISKFDWRTAEHFTDGTSEKYLRLSLRGSSGYVVFRDELFKHLRDEAPEGSRVWIAANDMLSNKHGTA